MSLPRLCAGPRKRLMAHLLLNGLGQAAVVFGTAWLLRDGLTVFDPDRAAGTEPYVAIVGGLVLAGAALLALRVHERVEAERLGQDFVIKTRLRLFERIVKTPSRHNRTERFGLTMTRLVTDLNALKNWVSLGVARMTVASVSITGFITGLAYFSPRAAVVALAVVAASLGLGYAVTPVLRERIRQARHRRGHLAGKLGERVFAAETVRHFGKTEAEIGQLRRDSRRLSKAMVRRMSLSATLRAAPEAALPLAVAVLIGIAAVGIGGRGPGEGELVISLLILSMIIASLRDVALAWDYRLSFQEARRRLEKILDVPPVREAAEAIDLSGEGPVSFEFQNVGVAGALNGVHCSARPGERILIAGPSGSGKSTLIVLAARLCDPDKGRVLLDNHPIRNISFASLHAAVQLVSPDLTLLRGTVAENIAYGLQTDDPKHERVAAVAAQCGLDKLNGSLANGLESRVEEKGRNLAEGARARIALARAVAAAPRLLLIDDSTFAVDSEARLALQEVLVDTSATVLMVGPEGQGIFVPDQVWRLRGGKLQIGDASPGSETTGSADEAEAEPYELRTGSQG